MRAHRVTERQADRTYAEGVTSSSRRAQELDRVLESARPKTRYAQWHPLLAASFRHPLPVGPSGEARFRPVGHGRNILYCSEGLETALYESSYHYLRQRIHVEDIDKDIGQRAAFGLELKKGAVQDLKKSKGWREIMDKKDYSASHAYIRENRAVDVLRYPSCRDPEGRDNYAVFDIQRVEKDVSDLTVLEFSYRAGLQQVRFWSAEGNVDFTVSQADFD